MKTFNTLILSKFIFLSFGLTIILLSSSCELFNDDDADGDGDPCTIVEEEISPDDRFACKVNGEIWRATNRDFFAEVLPDFSHFFGDAKRELNNCNDVSPRISIHVKNPMLGDNLLSAINRNFCSVAFCNNCYDIDTALNRTINFSDLDLEAGIANGTFSFQAVSEQCGDTVNITDGVFNLRW